LASWCLSAPRLVVRPVPERPAALAGGGGVRLQGFDHLVDVFLGQVDLVLGAVEGEGDGFVGVSAVDVVGEGGDGAGCHGGHSSILATAAGVLLSDHRRGVFTYTTRVQGGVAA
jgi:hypothetical protein